jgi:hemerythrin-like metal-binding protein
MAINAGLFGRIPMQHHALNDLIQWGDHLSVEHPGIDAQHKAIFELGMRVYETWRGGGGINILRPAVEKLANLLPAHFLYEERLLAEIRYDALEQHAAEHRTMLNDLAVMHGRFQTLKDGHASPGGSVLAPGWAIMQFILEFTVGHVMSSDMSYCRALVASRTASAGGA